MRYSLLVMAIIFATSCGLYWGEEPHDFGLQNNSSITVGYYFPSVFDYPSKDFPCKPYPDTSMSFSWWSAIGPVRPNETVLANRGLVEGAYGVYKTDTLSLFIFDNRLKESKIWVDLGDKRGYWKNDDWLKAMEEYDILARYDLSRGDVEKFRDDKGIVILYYPPTPEMKHIKMWPPYEDVIKSLDRLK